MPRKPLPENASKLWSIGPEALVRRPEHAGAIGRCLGLWTDVELQMAIVLAVLLKANTEAAIAVYLILRRGSARSDAIMAAAKATLDKRDQELISAVLTVHKSVEAERNSLAHGCWGTCNKIPDSVLWVDVADNANFVADYFSKEPGKSRTFSGREHADFAKKLFYYYLRWVSNTILGNVVISEAFVQIAVVPCVRINHISYRLFYILLVFAVQKYALVVDFNLQLIVCIAFSIPF